MYIFGGRIQNNLILCFYYNLFHALLQSSDSNKGMTSKTKYPSYQEFNWSKSEKVRVRRQNQVLSSSLASLCLQWEKNSSLWLREARSGLNMMVCASRKQSLQLLVEGL